MTRCRKIMVGGLVLVAVSILIGVSGTAWGIHRSLGAMKFNENAGIGAFGGAGLEVALLSTVVSLIGSAVGIAMTIVAAIKIRK